MPSLHSFLVNVASLTIWLVILTAIFVPLERLFELLPRRRTRRALAQDLGYYFLNSLLPTIILAVPIAGLIALAHLILPTEYFDWLNGLPLALQLAATFVVGEIGFYWGHRWSHEVPILWRFHAVHHEPEQLDWLINTRAHPVDMVFGRLCGVVPIYLLGLAGRDAGTGNIPAILFLIAGTIWGFFIHANMRWRLGWVDRVIATPRFHHWHHTQTPINRNYASMLPLMDRVFGTLHLPGQVWPERYGVAGTARPAESPTAQ